MGIVNEEIKEGKGKVVLVDRKILTLDGVLNVIGFDSGSVTLETNLGELYVEGEELKIESLLKDGGEIVIRGKISGFFYSEKKESKGLFRGLFK